MPQALTWDSHLDKRAGSSAQSILWLLAVLVTPAVAAEPAGPHYSAIAASADGIGKVYMGREISHVMGFHGASWLERAERLVEERPDRVLSALGIKANMTVADIGAGTGFYTWRIAERVGAAGIVYAVDVQPQMIKALEQQMSQRGAVNVRPVLGLRADPKLPRDSVDLALMVDVYHEFAQPYEMLAAIVRAVRPGGRVAFVEFRGNDPRVPIKPLHTMTEEQVRREAAVHSLEWVATTRDLPWQQVIVFRKP
jgi:SAM-dependent methyltransferase